MACLVQILLVWVVFVWFFARISKGNPLTIERFPSLTRRARHNSDFRARMQYNRPNGVLIVSGEDVSSQEHAFMVSIQIDFWKSGEFSHACGGSLVAPNKVLTAAHCLIYYGSMPYRVGLGMVNLTQGADTPEAQVIDVLSAEAHEEFQSGGNNGMPFDVAVLTLQRNAELNDKVKLVDLSNQSDAQLIGKTCRLFGWGQTSGQDNKLPVILQTAEFDGISLAQCRRKWGEDLVLETHVCVSGPPHSACMGDSGGPLVYRGKQVGIVSWGHDECDPSYPGVFTSVAVYRDWVIERL